MIQGCDVVTLELGGLAGWCLNLRFVGRPKFKIYDAPLKFIEYPFHTLIAKSMGLTCYCHGSVVFFWTRKFHC